MNPILDNWTMSYALARSRELDPETATKFANLATGEKRSVPDDEQILKQALVKMEEHVPGASKLVYKMACEAEANERN